MVLALIHQLDTADTILQSASTLAFQLQKEFCVLYFSQSDEGISSTEKKIEKKMATMDLISSPKIRVKQGILGQLTQWCEEEDTSFLFLQLSLSNAKSIRSALNACRELRIPYILFKDSYTLLNTEKVLVPVGFLEEEMEKAQFASAFGRFCKSSIHLLLANDAGTKAKRNAEKIKSLFEKFSFTYHESKANSDSFKVERESVDVAFKENYGLVIVSASRDYGLDDLIFGPKEYHVVKKSTVPILLVNPRGDLYALCD